MLTPKQEKFCQCIVDGMSQADAYRTAYNTENMVNESIYCEASKLMNNPNVAQRIEDLRAEIVNAKIMSATKRAIWLSDLIEGRDNAMVGDKLKAVDILNKMTGEYVTKIEGEVKVKKLEDLL